MSAVPPNVPPPPAGGGIPPNPQYDPKAQWRAYREQQKAAAYAQRMQWKAQRNAWKASVARRPSILVPILLIGIGVVALLVLMKVIPTYEFWTWYAHWWPVVLIVAGLVMLGEWLIDTRRENPVARKRGGFAGLVVLLAIVGLAASGVVVTAGHWTNFADNSDMRGNNFFSLFMPPEHAQDQQLLDTEVGANATVQIDNPRGDVSITAGDGNKVQVQAHKLVYANTDDEAQKLFTAVTPNITVQDKSVLIKADGNNHGRVNLTVTVPRTAQVILSANRGDITATGLGAGLTATVGRGDTRLNDVGGQVIIHAISGKSDMSLHQIKGDVSVDGKLGDFTVSQVQGRVTVNSDIMGDVHVENVTEPVSIHTSVTDVQIASLQGDLTFDSDHLAVTQAKGQVRVTTRSKDIDLNQITGDSYVETRNGRISITPTGSFNVDAKNSKGDVVVVLPTNVSATVDGHTRNGNITSDFPLETSGDTNKNVSGHIGAGAAKISISTDNGDLRIQKISSATATTMPTTPNPPVPTHAPHLKTHKGETGQPVTQ